MLKNIYKRELGNTIVLMLVVIWLTGILSVTSVQAQFRPIDKPIPGTDGVLIGADYWDEELKILSGGLGFEGIIGIDEFTEEAVRAAGASWYSSMTCTSGEEPADLHVQQQLQQISWHRLLLANLISPTRCQLYLVGR